MIRFSHGGKREADEPDRAELLRAVIAADPEYWNGVTGMSCVEYAAGPIRQYLYVSLDPGLGYYLQLEYRDHSRIYAHNPAPAGLGPGTIWWGGDETMLPADHFVAPEDAARVIGYFMQTADADPDTEWRLY